MAGRAFTAAQRAEAERARRAMVEALHQQLAQRIGQLDSREEWQRWLTFAASFHRYSFSNTVLIWAQKPDASLVGGYRSWLAKGRQVRRGETAIRILGPVTRRLPQLDAHGDPVRDAAGQPVLRTQLVGVKPVAVFDVSSTDGEPLPVQPQARLLTGQAPQGLWEAIQTLIEDQGFTVQRGDCGSANGLTMFDQRLVRVRADVDDAHAVRTLAHEAAHVLLHADADAITPTCRGVKEVEAESVAYLVTYSHGLDSSQYTFNYVAGWASQAASDPAGIDAIVAATGARVIAAADRILRHTQPDPGPEGDLVDALAGHTLTPAPVVQAGPWEVVTASPRLGPAAEAPASSSLRLTTSAPSW